jgi:phosphoglycerate dehydrogenase-like enzyme
MTMKRPVFRLCAAHGLRAAALALSLTLVPAAFAAVPTPAATVTLESLGLQPSGPPVREHPGWRAPKLILVSPNLHDQLGQLREAAPGVKFIELPQASARDLAAADAALGVCSAQMLGKARNLQWIQWLAAGVEGCVQQPLVHERHLILTNMQRTAAPSMAEHVIGLMLALSRHLDYFFKEQQAAHWVAEDSAPVLGDLEGKTVLVVGLGGIGTEVAKRAHALGMRVIATRASGRSGPDYVSYVGLPDELLKLAAEADFVVNCTPLTPQTTGIFNQAFFATLKPSAYFLNVGRGKSVVTADLIAALSAGKIAGAGLDVVDPEPLPADSPLWRSPHVIITPHISALTAVTEQQRIALLRENLRRYIAGEPLLAVVDVSHGY